MVEEKKQEEFKLVDVATEFGKAIQTPTGELVSDTQLLIWIANEISKMSKKLG
jgi:hypothetical protein